MWGYHDLQRTATSVQPNPISPARDGEIESVGLALTIAFPVLVVGAIVGYRKHRASVLQQRIRLLNQVWQLDALEK